MISGVLFTAPITSNAADSNVYASGLTYSGKTGACTWKLDTTTGVLSITGTGAMGDYSFSSDAPWDSYSSYVKTVNISNGVTSIGSYAFYYYTSLTSVTIPSSVTSIGSDAFVYCKGLTSITIPSSVTSIGSYAFEGCTSLTSIDVNSNNTKYSSVDGNLYNKNKTTLIQYAIGKTATSFTIPSSVKSIGSSAFYNCESLTSITIPSSVTSIGSYAFDKCTSLKGVTIPSSVTSIGSYAFYSCTSLTSLTIPSSITSIESWVFANCTSLTRVTIPSSVTSIGSWAFYYCTSLKSVAIPRSVKSIDSSAFFYCPSLISINVNSNNTKYSSINGNLYNKDKTELIQYAIGKTAKSFKIPSSVTSIGDYAFLRCTSLTSVTIPSGVKSIGSDAFSKCSNLKKIYYAGKESDWKKIRIGSGNQPIKKAKIYSSKTDELSKISYSSVKTKKLNSTTLKVTWGKVAKADGYKIKIFASYKGENHTIDKKIKNNYLVLYNTKKDQKLSIKIRPYKVSGGKTTYGSWVSKRIQ